MTISKCIFFIYKELNHATRCRLPHLSSFLLLALLALGADGCNGRQIPVITAQNPSILSSTASLSAEPVGPEDSEIHWPAAAWPSADPEARGMNPGSLAALLDAIPARTPNLTSLLIIRSGDMVLEKYFSANGPDTRHEIYSCTKSFIATLVGIALDQGYISGLESKVLDYFPGRPVANPDPRKTAVTMKNLLTMTTGLDWTDDDLAYRDLYMSEDWVQFMLDRPMLEPPGNDFNFCSGCSHLLSAILQEATGMNILEFGRRVLFQPLGMAEVEWLEDSRGIPIGGWGLHITPRDMARFGYLYLRNGVWEGLQMISNAWVKTATSPLVEVDENMSYGYQWWVRPSIQGYAALGRDGQMIAVIPGKELVVVFTSESGDNEQLFRLIEEYILPAVH